MGARRLLVEVSYGPLDATKLSSMRPKDWTHAVTTAVEDSTPRNARVTYAGEMSAAIADTLTDSSPPTPNLGTPVG